MKVIKTLILKGSSPMNDPQQYGSNCNNNKNVKADLQMVKTILRNLISNAIKYTNTGGEITVSASESELFIEIMIRDNGIGISFEAQKNLFKINGLHSTVGTHHEKGAGLGLLLCKEFVKRHCGDIQIKANRVKDPSLNLPCLNIIINHPITLLKMCE